MELFKANQQWANRPDDERFSTLAEMLDATRSYASQAAEADVTFNSLRVQADGDNKEMLLVGRSNVPARFTHYAFGQFCQRINAPANYLRALPPTLAAQNVNHGLKAASDTDAGRRNVNLLFHQNGSMILRAATSERYTRIWNYEIVGRLLPLEESGWQVPPARPARDGQAGTRRATPEDVLSGQGFGLSVRVGDTIAPAGLYASDHDMFVFMVNQQNRIADGSPEGLARGFFVENSEVGDGAFKITAFLYRHVCGNHIVWDAKDVMSIKIRHVGNADERAFRNLRVELVKYANSSASDTEAKIDSARRLELGKSKDEVLDALFKMRIPELSRKRIDAAYDLTEQHEDTDGNPRSVWGITQGLTRLSQATAYGDERASIDRAAGKVLKVAF